MQYGNAIAHGERLAAGDRLRDQGQTDEAIQVYREVIASAPGLAEAHYKLGTALMRQDRLDEAEAALHSALELRPDYAEANNNLGLLLDRRGETAEAEACFRRILAARRGHPEASNNLGRILTRRGAYADAEAVYRQALAEHPDYVLVHMNLGNLLQDLRRYPEAIYHQRRATLLDPDASAPWDRLGSTLRWGGAHAEAIVALEKALALDPKNASAWNNLGACHYDTGRLAEAEHAFGEAVRCKPDMVEAWSNYLLAANYRTLDRDAVFARHREFGEHLVASLAQSPARWRVVPDPVRRLRVGFVSADLRMHSVSYFLEGMLGRLDRKQIEAWAYYTNTVEDTRTERLKPLFRGWRNIRPLDDAAAAELIRDDRIDVLFDLAGHTAGNRPGLFARKPAPVQVAWLGYPNTSGLPTMDYRLTDCLADPEELAGERWHTEKLWRLPRSFLCYAPPFEMPPLVVPPALSNGYVTFGSYNARTKIGDESLDLWASVLRAVPGARMVIKCMKGIDEASEREAIRAEFARRGIDGERILPKPSTAGFYDHLAAYGEVDICLDTFPYHGTTTTCEALWMGVPVITQAGDRHASRVGVSLLTNAGFPDLIARDPAHFVAIASGLAADTRRLASMRETIRERLLDSPLTDAATMAADFEAAVRGMWRAFVETCPADAIAADAAEPEAPPLLRLNLGGTIPREGWKILNIQSGPDVDYVGDILDLGAFNDGCCSDIYASHVLEHVGTGDILDVLTACHRLLAPGGKLYISVPDLDTLCRMFVDPELTTAERFTIMRVMFGAQMDEHDFHHIGFNFEFMLDYLRAAGFERVERVESFGLFDDISASIYRGEVISLNLIAYQEAGGDETGHWAEDAASQITVRLHGGASIVVSSDISQPTTWITLEQEDWFEDEIRFLRHACRPGWQALDIGANHGVYALALASHGATRVWAFEPASEPMVRLRASIRLNRYDRIIEPLAIGLSDAPRQATISVSRHSEVNSLHDSFLPSGHRETLVLQRLDDFACEQIPAGTVIDFVKLDVEGEELAVLRGGDSFFREQSPLAMFEARRGDGLNAPLIDAFRALGYGIYRLVPCLACLTPLAPEALAALDPFTLNLFACKPDRAQALQDAGLLVAAATGAQAAPALDPGWIDALFDLPAWSAQRGAAWRNTPDTPYSRALLAWCGSRRAELSPAARHELLLRAVQEFHGALAADDLHPAVALLGVRIHADAGERMVALNIARAVFDQMEEDELPTDRPYPPPYDAFDDRRPLHSTAAFMRQALLEFMIDRSRHSLVFEPPQDELLDLALAGSDHTSRLERGACLCRIRSRREIALQDDARILEPSADNLNATFWRDYLERMAILQHR
jgi:FkbM family methyltransferase